MSNLRKLNKDRLTAFLEHLNKKNLKPDKTLKKCLVSSYKKNI